MININDGSSLFKRNRIAAAVRNRFRAVSRTRIGRPGTRAGRSGGDSAWECDEILRRIGQLRLRRFAKAREVRRNQGGSAELGRRFRRSSRPAI